MKKIVLFDIDYTLFNKDIFFEELFKSIAEALNIDVNIVTGAGHEAYKENIIEVDYLEPNLLSSKIAEKLGRIDKLKTIESIVNDSYNSPGSLYEETIDVLRNISEVATIGIFSKGHTGFQKNKLTIIKHLIDESNIHIFVDKDSNIKEVLEKYDNSNLFLVDDKLSVLKLAKDFNGKVFTIWIKRGPYAESGKNVEKFEPDSEVLNLAETIPIILGS